MRRIIEVEPPAQTSRISPTPVGSRPWWQTCSLEEFNRRVEGMVQTDVQALKGEIGAAIAITSSLVNDVTRDKDQRRRASRALSYMVEKRRLLGALLSRIQKKPPGPPPRKIEKDRRKIELLSGARAALAQGDQKAAIEAILDLLDPSNSCEQEMSRLTGEVND